MTFARDATFMIEVTRAEFLTLPMPVRRRSLRKQTDVFLMTQSDIQIIHNLYCHLTRFRLRLEMWRERYWYEFMHAGFTCDDLSLVISRLQRGIKTGDRREGCLRFSNLIEDLPHFEEELALARAHLRNNRPKTNREAIIEVLRPTVKENLTVGQSKPAKDVLIKLSDELRKAVPL